MPPRKPQTQGKRARESGSNSDQDGDTIYLEMLGRISALASKDKENTKRLENMQSVLDQANACKSGACKSDACYACKSGRWKNPLNLHKQSMKKSRRELTRAKKIK